MFTVYFLTQVTQITVRIHRPGHSVIRRPRDALSRCLQCIPLVSHVSHDEQRLLQSVCWSSPAVTTRRNCKHGHVTRSLWSGMDVCIMLLHKRPWLWTRILYGSVAKWSLQNSAILVKKIMVRPKGGAVAPSPPLPLKYATGCTVWPQCTRVTTNDQRRHDTAYLNKRLFY